LLGSARRERRKKKNQKGFDSTKQLKRGGRESRGNVAKKGKKEIRSKERGALTRSSQLVRALLAQGKDGTRRF